MTVSFNTWVKNWKSIISWNYLRDRVDPVFVLSVIKQSMFERKNPDCPWLTVEMVNILENLLRKEDVGFEFGSGNSTTWLAKKTKKLTSVEHDKQWYKKVKEKAEKSGLKKKVDLHLVEETEKSYVQPILAIESGYLDYCLVDGIFRDECILRAIDKLKSGGILIVDNVDNYFPKNKVSISMRYKRDNFSKTVSVIKMKKIYSILSGWRCIWTSSAIQDTALWIKP